MEFDFGKQHFLLSPHNVFKSFFLRGVKNPGLCGEGLRKDKILKSVTKFKMYPN